METFSGNSLSLVAQRTHTPPPSSSSLTHLLNRGGIRRKQHLGLDNLYVCAARGSCNWRAIVQWEWVLLNLVMAGGSRKRPVTAFGSWCKSKTKTWQHVGGVKNMTHLPMGLKKHIFYQKGYQMIHFLFISIKTYMHIFQKNTKHKNSWMFKQF